MPGRNWPRGQGTRHLRNPVIRVIAARPTTGQRWPGRQDPAIRRPRRTAPSAATISTAVRIHPPRSPALTAAKSMARRAARAPGARKIRGPLAATWRSVMPLEQRRIARPALAVGDDVGGGERLEWVNGLKDQVEQDDRGQHGHGDRPEGSRPRVTRSRSKRDGGWLSNLPCGYRSRKAHFRRSRFGRRWSARPAPQRRWHPGASPQSYAYVRPLSRH